MSHLELRLLGPMQILLDGKAVTGFESNKVRALLAFLAAEAPRPQSRESLAELLWPGWPQASALSNLRYALSDLRKNLGDREAQPPFLRITRQSLQLNLESRVQVDVQAMDQAISDGADGEALRAAATLYRGPFLEGFPLPENAAFTDWLHSMRAYYDRQALVLFDRCLQMCWQAVDHAGALDYARRALAVEPWREESHRQVMRLLARSGQRSAALAQFEECRRQLVRELGVDPSAETTRLYQSIRAGNMDLEDNGGPGQGKQSTMPSSGVRLPRQLTSLIGREQAVNEVKALLDLSALVTLTGSGGVGKTRLAIQVCAELSPSFADGVWFVELAAISETEQVIPAVTRALGLRPAERDPDIETLLAFLNERQALVVLDNCEHMLQICADLSVRLLQGCPGFKLLATSRQALGVTGEVLYRVPSLSVPQEGTPAALEQLRSIPAVALFSNRARAVQAGFTVTEQNSAAVAQICRRLDGIPLAIELAAARVALLSPAQLAERLQDAFNLLTSGSRAALPRQQTLRATIDWSYHLLNEKERILMHRLAVFAGSFILEAAEEVCSLGELASREILHLLEALVNKSIVHVLPGESEVPRYRLLETVRQYALEKLDECGETSAMRDSHLDYYARFAEQAEAHYPQPDRLPWIHRFADELDNLRGAIEWSYHGLKGPVGGLRIAAAGWKLMQNAGLVNEERAWLKTGLENFEDFHLPYLLRARALYALAWQEFNWGDWTQIPPLCQEADDLCRAVGAGMEHIRSLILGLWATVIKNSTGETVEAGAMIEEAFALAQAVNAFYPLVMALSARSGIFFLRGEPELAHKCLEEAARMIRQYDLPEGAVFWFLADNAAGQGDFEKELTYDNEALRVFQSYEDIFGCGETYFRLAMVYLKLGQVSQAGYYARKVLLTQEPFNLRELTVRNLATVMVYKLAAARNPAEGIPAQQLYQAAVLLGAAKQHQLRKYDAEIVQKAMEEAFSNAEAQLRSILEPARFEKALAEGRAMTLDRAIRFARED